MISRYTRPEMAVIWEAQTRFKIWFEIEAHAADALAELGVIPKEAAKTVWAKARDVTFDVARIDEIERETKHDVIAFLTHLAEIVGPEARFVHQGMTSSDVLDTCLNVQLTRAADLLLSDIDKLLAALKKRAFEYKMTPTIGRSHGIHAEPVTFGLKLAYAYAEFTRARERLVAARKEVATCAISGAVGTFAQIDPRVEAHVAKAMGLVPEPISTQVIPRDRHAMYFATLGVIASSVERLATEIRHLQRTEVLEAEEFFSEGQKGSSAMPHKRNPVLSENLTGLSRMVRAYVTPAMENVVLWHERDISHSSAERMMAPDATVTLDFALNRLAGLVDKLLVYPANMMMNLDRLGGLIHSQRLLIALTQKGASREDAYKLVQRNAMPVWRGDGDFQTLLKKDAGVKQYLSDPEISEQFDLDYHFKHVDTIFKRVFGEKLNDNKWPLSSPSAWVADHRFSKTPNLSVRLLEGLGVAGDAHMGATVKHRSRVRKDPTLPNLRQVHLIPAELLDELRAKGFEVAAGELGENITTLGIDLLGLPAGTRLRLGASAVVEITGLRNPCVQIERFQKGLLAATLDQDANGNPIRKAGVMSIVITAGDVRPADPHHRRASVKASQTPGAGVKPQSL